MSKTPGTHVAYVLRRETRTRSRYIEIGFANIEPDGVAGRHYVRLDRLPVGGFSGHIILHPHGDRPPEVAALDVGDDSAA